MKLSKLVGDRFKERPSDCVIDSHALMVRGGYMKYVANGIYSQYMPLRRVCQKIEAIIRDEMDKIDGQEVQFPVACRHLYGKNPEDMKALEVNCFVSKTETEANGTWYDP